MATNELNLSSKLFFVKTIPVMKLVILTVFILSQDISVNCNSFFNVMTSKMQKALTYISSSIKSATDKVVGYILNKDLSKESREEGIDITYSYYVDRPVNYEEMKHLFNDYLKRKSFSISSKNHRYASVSMLLAMPELARWHGKEVESHIVQISDGYYLTLYRLRVKRDFIQVNRTVLLHHGLLGSSNDWILLGPDKSLPYILDNAGYDVWITNARGNYYSRGHLSTGPSHDAYWNFSWEEMGKFDLPAVIDYIRKTKQGDEYINFIGHSMGATAFLVMLSTMPNYNRYIRMGILLGPLAFMNHIKGPMEIFSAIPEETIKLLGSNEFLASRKVPSWLLTDHCKGSQKFCRNPLLFLSGFIEDPRWDAGFIARMMYHIPAGGSMNTILHYLRVARNSKFHSFKNSEDEFNLTKVTVPIAVVSSADDFLATEPDVLKLYFRLPFPLDHHILRNQNVSHTDLVWGTDAPYLVFERIVKYLEQVEELDNVKLNEIDLN